MLSYQIEGISGGFRIGMKEPLIEFYESLEEVINKVFGTLLNAKPYVSPVYSMTISEEVTESPRKVKVTIERSLGGFFVTSSDGVFGFNSEEKVVRFLVNHFFDVSEEVEVSVEVSNLDVPEEVVESENSRTRVGRIAYFAFPLHGVRPPGEDYRDFSIPDPLAKRVKTCPFPSVVETEKADVPGFLDIQDQEEEIRTRQQELRKQKEEMRIKDKKRCAATKEAQSGAS